jgi:long-chain fatty acid transport protein
MTLQTTQGRFQTPRLHPFAIAGLALACGQAMAMNGAQLGGYGIKNAGMGGASIAMPLDASAAANNPAGMAFVPTSVVGNVVLFKGQSTLSVPPNGPFPSNQLIDNTTTYAPEGGFNWVVNSQMTIGLTLSGSGAGADLGEPLVPFPGLQNLKSSQKVADVIPSISWKISPNLAVGLGVIFSFQEFEAQGVIRPTPLGPQPSPNHGKEKAQGVGARIGLQWNATPALSVGATYKARTPMSKLGKYGDTDNILAHSGGKVDIPSEYGIGLAWKATPSVTLAADFLEVQYSDVTVMKDPRGQMWKDQSILRLGASWEMNPTWTLRGGLSRNQRQITSDRTRENLLSPAINNVAYTFGASMKLDPKSDISFSLEHNPSQTLNGTGPVSQDNNITSKTQVIRVGYQKQF